MARCSASRPQHSKRIEKNEEQEMKEGDTRENMRETGNSAILQ